MEDQATPIETLAHKAQDYVKTNIDLLKLQGVDKLSDVAGTLVIKLVFILFFLLIAMMVNFGLALWIGTLLGASYYGFFAVALFYVLLALIVYFCKKDLIHAPVKNAVIKDILDEN